MNSSDTNICDSLANDAKHGELGGRADETALRLGNTDHLTIMWGGIVSQKAGVCALYFGKDSNYWILLVNKGTLKLKLDNEIFEVAEGQTFLVLPGETCFGAEPNTTSVQWQWVAFEVAAARRPSKILSAEVPRVFTTSDPARITELFRMLIEEFHVHYASHPEGRLSAKGAQYLLMSLLARLASSQTNTPLPANTATVLAERAKDYIRTNIARPINTSEVADALECSDGYLGLAFRRTYGESPGSYILRTRTGIARTMLAETRNSVGQIAKECGFNSLNYFTRVFKRFHGMSPTAYRIANSHLYITTDI